MIYLSCDIKKLQSVLDMNFRNSCIKNIIELYLKAYGAEYEFAQFYIQELPEGNKPTAVILRYNNTVYSISNDCCDTCELSAFLCGFTDSELIADTLLSTDSQFEVCAVMSKQGVHSDVQNSNVVTCNDPKAISNLVCENMQEDRKTEFFLNTAHQMRHNLITVLNYVNSDCAVSVASVFYSDRGEAVIPFVYTGEYFRGNGYSKAVLDVLCSNPEVYYQLICEEHNIKFYEKCGFSETSSCYKYNL